MLVECKNNLIVRILNCNFNCDYCNIPLQSDFDINSVLNEAIERVKTNKKFNTVWITGGEPLLYQDKLIPFCLTLRKIFPAIRIYLKTTLVYYMSFYFACLINGISISIKPNYLYDNFDMFIDNFLWLPKQFFSLKEFRLIVHKLNINDLLETLCKFLLKFKRQERAIYKDFVFKFVPAKFLPDFTFNSTNEILCIVKEYKDLYEIIKNNLIIDFNNDY